MTMSKPLNACTANGPLYRQKAPHSQAGAASLSYNVFTTQSPRMEVQKALNPRNGHYDAYLVAEALQNGPVADSTTSTHLLIVDTS